MTKEQTKAAEALEKYLNLSMPIVEALCKLETAMPPSFVKNADGSLFSTGRECWPEWAKDHAAKLEEMLKFTKDSCFQGV